MICRCTLRGSFVFSWERGHLGRTRSRRDARAPGKTKTALPLNLSPRWDIIYCELPYHKRLILKLSRLKLVA